MSGIAGLEILGVEDMPSDWGKFLIHGPQGSGKSTLASTIAMAGKTLFVDLVGEKGVRSFKGAKYAKNVDVIRPQSVADLDDVYYELASGNSGYKAVVIDSLTALQKMAMRYVLGHSETAVREIKQGTAPARIQDWGQTLDIITTTVTFWYELADGFRDNPLHVVMTSQTKMEENEETGNIQRTPDVQKGALRIVKSTPEHILYTDLEEDIEESGEDGTPYRHIVRVGNNPDYQTKARVPSNLNGKIPPILGRKSQPTLIALGKKLGLGGMPASKKSAETTNEEK